MPPEVAFNLAVPTFFALTVAGAFSVSYNLAAARAAVRARRRHSGHPRWSLYAAGLLGAFFVAVAGNLDGIDQLSTASSASAPGTLDTPLPLLDGVINSVGGLWQVVVPRREPAALRLLALRAA